MLYRQRSRRLAITVVECAVVYPITFLLTLVMIMGALGVFRLQEAAWLAREGARWASVHGRDYAVENGQSQTTASDVYTNVIQPKGVMFDPSRLTYSVTWANSSQRPIYLDPTTTPTYQPRRNWVRVTVTYQWIPEAYLGGVTLSSTSEMPITY